ncbi:uncharacterized protein LOC128556331 [Mercenaria mercenaria]|uniref:uncharacterized protein LOC128556331 n=1 Tax=Mercenaria mercenaria TaxID=6596 RepID=UPI00234E3CCC|nr:uncharacterized protein LOC128556331 [Mercenaria mercenaria]
MSAGKRTYRSYLHNQSEPKLPRTTEWRLKTKRNDSNCDTDTTDITHTTGAESDINNDNDNSLPHDDMSYSGQQDTGTADNNSAEPLFDTLDNEDQNIAFTLNNMAFNNTPDENEETDTDEDSLSSDSSDEQSEEESVNDEELFDESPDDEPLYSNAAISVSETLMLLLTFAIRHCLSFAALNDLLKLVSALCPQPNNVKTSVRKVWAYFGNINSEKVLHFYCKNCYKHLSSRIQPQEGTTCGGCGKQLTGKEPYFLHISLIQQIRNLFLKEDFVQNLSYRFERELTTDICDVHDGLKYKELFKDGGLLSDQYNISLQMNTDGVAIFKSSNVSVWPIYMTVNELPPKARFSRNMRIFAGLWFGSAKPNMTTFLRPLAEELFEAYNGITLTINNQIVTVRSILLTACLDAPARCMFQYFTQFNGENGCGYCTEKGKVVTSGKGHSRIYPFNSEHESKLGHDSLRTHEQTKRNAVLAQNSKKAVQGVKGISWGLILPHFDIILGVPIDYMHAVLLGVVKQLITFWFDKSYSKYP